MASYLELNLAERHKRHTPHQCLIRMTSPHSQLDQQAMTSLSNTVDYKNTDGS